MSKEYEEFAEEFGRIVNRAVMNNANMKFIGETVRRSIQKNFEQEGRYGAIVADEDSDDRVWLGGTGKWVDLRGTTKKQREKRGKYPGKILQVTGSLKSSINYTISGSNIEFGSGKQYGEFLQYGTVNMAPRPFLMIQDEDIDEIEQQFAEYLAGEFG